MTEQEWLTSVNPAEMLGWITHPSDNANPHHLYPPSDRKLRLFACACCRAVWHLLTDERSRNAVEVSERFADGEASKDERVGAEADMVEVFVEAGPMRGSFEAELVARTVGPISLLLENIGLPLWFSVSTKRAAAQAALLRELVGNPFDPNVLAVDGGWLLCFRTGEGGPSRLPYDKVCPITPTVLSLAQAAYDERLPDGTLDPHRLAVLSDALEEAGCPAEEKCGECPVLQKAKVTASGYYDRNMVQEVIAWGKAKKACRCGGVGRVPQPILAHLRGPGPHVRGCWAVDLFLGKH